MIATGKIGDRLYRGGLSLSFVLLTCAVLVSYHSPAVTYELDIYRSTPALFWVCVGTALCICITLSVWRFICSKQNWLSVGASAYCVVLIVALPLIRGYHHIGEADIMTHLGWTTDLLNGVLAPNDLLYPVVHTLVATIFQMTGLEITRTYLLLSVLLVTLFIAFTALCARLLSPRRGILMCGVFVGLLLLPINQSATDLQPLPRNAAAYLLPMVLFSAIYLLTNRRKSMFLTLLLISVAYLFVHPQFAIGVGIALAVSLAVFVKLRPSANPYTVARQPAAAISVLGILTWYWIRDLGVFERFFQLIVSFLVADRGESNELASRGASLTQLGSGLGEMFMKITLLPVLACIIVGGYGAKVMHRVYTSSKNVSREDALYLSLLIAIVPLSGLMLTFLAMGRIDYLFRYQGFIMALVTVLSAVAGRHVFVALPDHGKALFIPIFLVFLALSVLVMFPSPYIYTDSGHVTEAQMEGYDRLFEHTNPKIDSYDYLRSGVGRYGNAILGTSYQHHVDYRKQGYQRTPIPNHFNNQQIASYYSEPTYLAITTADIERDANLYNGFRYGYDDFEYLDQEPNSNKIISSKDTQIYYITPSNESA